jgi:GNAT superfamily N-acetyltransferase
MNVRLRSMTVDDIPEAMRLKDLAGWNQTAADWQRFLSDRPEGCFAAERDGHLVGTSTTIVYEGRFAWIGMVIVDPELRGRGIGTALLKRAIEYLDSLHIPCMKLDATPQGRILYEKFGFVAEYDIERWMLKRHSRTGILPVNGRAGILPVPANDRQDAGPGILRTLLRDPAVPEIELTAVSGDIDDVLRLDREIFGADRGTLLLSMTETSPEFAIVARGRAGIEGYTFGRRGSLADHLGPWMARTEEVAAALLDEFLRCSERELVFVDCLRDNPWAVALVRARGFGFQRPLTRMFRGKNEHPGRHELLCAVLGPEFG